jgi:hypothetical protein
MSEKENILLKKKHILIYLDAEKNKEIDYLINNFCGTVLTEINDYNIFSSEKIIYMCGNISKINKEIDHKAIYVIKELSNNYDICESYEIISLGMVPINIHNVGIYFRNFFERLAHPPHIMFEDSDSNADSKDYFNLIKNEHEFQILTESNKPNNAFRKGIYLSKVENVNDELRYNLLRCSSNLSGATDNFRNTDNEIISQINNITQHFFEEKTELNHVLAQIYENSDQGKAKIKAHSDKTKDMPRNGLIAFCTFYESYNKLNKSKNDLFDYCYKQTSALTRLHFKLKQMVEHSMRTRNTLEDENLTKEFSITLYPNSVFIIPLSTNRLYTHEIRSSILPFDKIPTRMGYVVRCSKTKAIFKDNNTYIDKNGQYIKLEEINEDNRKELRDLYYEENITDKMINYGDIYFSMNNGDYMKPNL